MSTIKGSPCGLDSGEKDPFIGSLICPQEVLYATAEHHQAAQIIYFTWLVNRRLGGVNPKREFLRVGKGLLGMRSPAACAQNIPSDPMEALAHLQSSIDYAIDKVGSDLGFTLKLEQKISLLMFASGRDVFNWLWKILVLYSIA